MPRNISTVFCDFFKNVSRETSGGLKGARGCEGTRCRFLKKAAQKLSCKFKD
jgi:hypothetical protein